MTRIRMLSGLTAGIWQAEGSVDDCTMTGPNGELIKLHRELVGVEKVTTEKYKDWKEMGATAVVGAALLGPLAALGAGMLFGDRSAVTFVGELRSGKKFVAQMEGRAYLLMVATAVKNG